MVARRRTDAPRVSVVVPALNEALSLAVVLPQLPAVHEVILVDGGSVDGTVDAARRARPGLITVAQARRGKGNALAAGLAQVTGDIVVTFDADGTADPAEIDRFVAALTAGADVANGSRFIPGGGSSGIRLISRIGHAVLSGTFNLGFGTRYTDLCYGYNAFWADLIPLLDLPDHLAPAPRSGEMLWGDGFEIETLVSCRFAVAGVDIAEVASMERPRLFGSSKTRAFSDGLRVLRTLRTERSRARSKRRLDKQIANRSAVRVA